jgi:protein gp37
LPGSYQTSFGVRVSEKELEWCPPEPSKIFVGSSLELFDPAIPGDWIQRIIDMTASHPENVYIFLSKNPSRYAEFSFSSNCWLGTTWDGLDHTKHNVELLLECAQSDVVRFVSFEPLLAEPPGDILSEGIDWIIVGANSNPGAPKAPDSWADMLIQQAEDLNIPVWVKGNYRYRQRIKKAPALQELQMALF